jgi:hypothetical protein
MKMSYQVESAPAHCGSNASKGRGGFFFSLLLPLLLLFRSLIGWLLLLLQLAFTFSTCDHLSPFTRQLSIAASISSNTVGGFLLVVASHLLLCLLLLLLLLLPALPGFLRTRRSESACR